MSNFSIGLLQFIVGSLPFCGTVGWGWILSISLMGLLDLLSFANAVMSCE